MADIKVTGLTALTSLSTDDLLMIVDDPGGTPASKKMTAANFIAGVQANTTLNDLSDVTIAGAASGEVLKYNGSGWVNGTDTSYSDEQAQDAVGTILVDSSTVDFTYSDATPSITASVIDGSITTTKLGGDISVFAKTLLDDTSAGSMQTTLNLVPGTHVQAYDAELAALAGLASAADALPYFTGAGTASTTTLTSFARTLLDDTSQGGMQTTLGLVPGTNVQAYDAELAAIAGLTSAADKVPYFTGSGTAALATLTSAARDLLDDTSAGGMRTTLSAATTTQTDACFSGFIETPADKTYKLVVKAPHGGTITECTTISASGTCTATFKINTTALGGTANSVSSTEQSQSHSSSNVFAAGDDIQLTVSSNSSCTDMSFTIKYTRTLA